MSNYITTGFRIFKFFPSAPNGSVPFKNRVWALQIYSQAVEVLLGPLTKLDGCSRRCNCQSETRSANVYLTGFKAVVVPLKEFNAADLIKLSNSDNHWK